MLVTIREDTWNVLNIQQITPNSKRLDCSDTPVVAIKILKDPSTWLKVATTLESPPISNHIIKYEMKLFTQSQPSTLQTLKFGEYMNSFIPHWPADEITYPCWDLSLSMLVKGVSNVRSWTSDSFCYWWACLSDNALFLLCFIFILFELLFWYEYRWTLTHLSLPVK